MRRVWARSWSPSINPSSNVHHIIATYHNIYDLIIVQFLNDKIREIIIIQGNNALFGGKEDRRI